MDFQITTSKYIQSLIDAGEHDFIFVSSHDVVRMELQERNIDYVLVYPDKSLKRSIYVVILSVVRLVPL